MTSGNGRPSRPLDRNAGRGIAARVGALIEPDVEALGYELLGVEYVPGSRHGVLRIYIDTPADASRGITLDDCARVSDQVSGTLDVEDPIGGSYDLEVSSPGEDRPLFRPAHFDRFRGARARVRLHEPVDGRRQVTGALGGVRDGRVVVVEDETEWLLPFESIRAARLVPDPGPARVPGSGDEASRHRSGRRTQGSGRTRTHGR